MVDRSDRRPARSAGADRALIPPGARVTIAGTSGSGKSTLLRHLIRRYRRAVLLDVKLDDPLPDWHHTHGAPEFERDFPARSTQIVAQPAPFEDVVEWFDRVCRWCFRVGAVAVGIDDLPGELAVNGQRSPGLENLYRQGRTRQVTTIGCIQRPKSMPLVMLTEASHLFVFSLLLPEDRDRIRGLIGDYPLPRRQHGFVYARPGVSAPIECSPLPR